MEIAKLGEFGLIRHLTDSIKLKNNSSLKGVGDDCAVVHYPDTEVLITTDMLMEGVHFDLTYTDMRSLGFKSAMVNISDVFAMNGQPRQMTVSIALSKRFNVEDLELFYAGLHDACDQWNIDIVGGDTTTSMTGLAISITCIGEARKEDIVYRNGAHDTDLICVSGDLGAAYMGLQLLEREKTIYYQQIDDIRRRYQQAKAEGKNVSDATLQQQLEAMSDFQPDFAGKEYLLQRQLKPEARGDIIDLLRNDYQTAVAAEEFNMNVTTCAMNGGEDYELLFTVPIGDYEKVQELENVRVIGHITRQELGLFLISRDGNEFEITAQGWNPLK